MCDDDEGARLFMERVLGPFFEKYMEAEALVHHPGHVISCFRSRNCHAVSFKSYPSAMPSGTPGVTFAGSLPSAVSAPVLAHEIWNPLIVKCHGKQICTATGRDAKHTSAKCCDRVIAQLDTLFNPFTCNCSSKVAGNAKDAPRGSSKRGRED